MSYRFYVLLEDCFVVFSAFIAKLSPTSSASVFQDLKFKTGLFEFYQQLGLIYWYI